MLTFNNAALQKVRNGLLRGRNTTSAINNLNTLIIYTGPMPANIGNNFTFAISDYAAQRMATITVSTVLNADSTVIIANIANDPTPAVIAGTATWFALYSSVDGAANSTIIGNISDWTNLTAPLILRKTVLEQNEPITIVGLTIKFM